jgi:hypothetical protein
LPEVLSEGGSARREGRANVLLVFSFEHMHIILSRRQKKTYVRVEAEDTKFGVVVLIRNPLTIC